MTASTARRRPGREIPKFERRIVSRLVDQGWRYEPTANGHFQLYAPDGVSIVTSGGTASDWRSRMNWLADLKRQGADLDRKPRTTARAVLAPLDTQYVAVESRPRLRNGANGWNYKPPPTPVVPPPEPAVVPPNPDDAKGAHWTLAQARALIRQGYHLRKVVAKTGWGRNWFTDLVDQSGYLDMTHERTTA